MNFVVFDAIPDPLDHDSQDYLNGMVDQLESGGNLVKVFTLREMDIKHCTGCWTCWWKTPGRCVFQDDMAQIYPAMLAADRLVMFSPLSMGFVSSLLKKVNDRSVPLLHPYIEIVQGECHHRKRYEKYPDLALIVNEEADTDDYDLEIINDLYQRFALNFRSDLKVFASVAQTTPEEAAYAVSRV
jgi:multimeric flavodoxin WrbA